MTLFSSEIDKSVKKPAMQEFEDIKKRLTKAVKDAQKAGNKTAIEHARKDLYDHLKLLDHYQDAANNQLSIFDV